MRHELAVAYASARYLARGLDWTRDRRPVNFNDHQADGVATTPDRVEYVEVELTPKMTERYRLILRRYADRLEEDERATVTYLCTAEATRIVTREADRHLFRDLRGRLRTETVFDRHGHWILETSSAG